MTRKVQPQALSHWYLNAFDLSRELSPKELRDLAAYGQTRRYQAGEVIRFAGDFADSVCLLFSGLVELTRPQESGRDLVVSLVRPSEVFGVLALIGHVTEPTTARARTPSEVCFITPATFRAMLQARPQTALTLIKTLKGREVTLENRIEALVFKGLPARVAHTLLQIAQAYGKRTEHGIRFMIPLTQQNLADFVGASRQHVNYVLADFRSRDLISGRGTTFTLTDVAGLEKIALAP